MTYTFITIGTASFIGLIYRFAQKSSSRQAKRMRAEGAKR